ncbi:MAG: hypothetical protein J3K34DRAFT_204585 [Monoraphidium minutum]|nr:MAG: hypothetical protein J3K34DRAFT_204585 [Monoraphidium minutum]
MTGRRHAAPSSHCRLPRTTHLRRALVCRSRFRSTPARLICPRQAAPPRPCCPASGVWLPRSLAPFTPAPARPSPFGLPPPQAECTFLLTRPFPLPPPASPSLVPQLPPFLPSSFYRVHPLGRERACGDAGGKGTLLCRSQRAGDGCQVSIPGAGWCRQGVPRTAV